MKSNIQTYRFSLIRLIFFAELTLNRSSDISSNNLSTSEWVLWKIHCSDVNLARVVVPLFGTFWRSHRGIILLRSRRIRRSDQFVYSDGNEVGSMMSSIVRRQIHIFFFIRIPFNQSTFGGYFGIIAIELTTALCYILVIWTIVSLFLSMGLYFGALSSHFESIFGEISTQSSRTIETKKCMIEAIKFHNQAKEYARLYIYKNFGYIWCDLPAE